MSRSKTLTKSLALSPETHMRVSELREKLRLRTYDDTIKYLMGDFKSANGLEGNPWISL
jgi:hypothetical protein